MTYYMGIFGYGPNASAALIRNGSIIAFAEEERFNRIKQAPYGLPIASIIFCLRQGRISLDEVARIGFAWDAERYVRFMPAFYENLRNAGLGGDDDYSRGYESWLLWNYDPIRIRTEFSQSLALQNIRVAPDRLEFVPHHLCHAASAFYASGYRNAAVLTIDGSGEETATAIWRAGPNGIECIREYTLPHTLGGAYATFTEYLGFKAYEEEGKLMGLAPYGAARPDLRDKMDSVFKLLGSGPDYIVNPRMRYIGPRTHGRRFTDELVDLFGPPRFAGQEITFEQKDIAFSVQERLELIVSALVDYAVTETGEKSICMAGGVAMNCKMNGAIALKPNVERIYVQPASSDNGVALGAAYLLAAQNGCRTFEPMTSVYLGPEFSDQEIEKALKEAKIAYRRPDDIVGETSDALVQGRIVGWFQGRMEVGARALGARSILANPLAPDMRTKINLEVKHRENWRPFCPSIISERFNDYFDTNHMSDYMILAFPVREEKRTLVPAVVHVDGTARPQTVRKATNPRFHALIERFGEKTGHPILLNSSFNIQGEPIVCTPTQALRCFGGTGIDLLAIGSFIVEKSK